MKKTIYIFFALYNLQVNAQTQPETFTLDECIKAALDYNPVIIESQNNVDLSLTGINIARSAAFPVLSLEASAGFSDEYRSGSDTKTASTGVTFNQVLWQKGKINSLIEQSEFFSEASKASSDGIKQDVIFSVSSAYFICKQQLKLYEISLENITRAELFLSYAQERYKIGIGRKSDILKAESDLAEAQVESNSYQNLFNQTRNELSMLTGISFDKLSHLNDTSTDQFEIFNLQSDSIINVAFQQYPNLLFLKNLGLSQEEKIKEVRADFFPQLYFNAGYNWNSTPLFQNQDNWYSMVTIRWNMFAGNEKRYKLQYEQIRKNIYENKKQDLQNFIIKEVKNRIINIREAEDRIFLTNRLIKSSSENLELARAQYKAGTGSLLELTDVRITNLNAMQQNIRAKTAYLIAIADLKRLTGNINKYEK